MSNNATKIAAKPIHIVWELYVSPFLVFLLSTWAAIEWEKESFFSTASYPMQSVALNENEMF